MCSILGANIIYVKSFLVVCRLDTIEIVYNVIYIVYHDMQHVYI